MVQVDVQELSENHLRDAKLNSSKLCRAVHRYQGTRMNTYVDREPQSFLSVVELGW